MEPSGEPTSPPTPAVGTSASVDALIRFIRGYSSSLLRYIQQIFPATLKSRWDPVDLFQDTVFEAFRRAQTFRHISDQATIAWLKLLARRQIGRLVRAERRQKRQGDLPASDPGTSKPAGLVKDFGLYIRTPSQSAMRTEAMTAVEQALITLPPHLQVAVRLRYIEELELPEIAARMKKSERAVAALIYRGLRLLERKLRHLAEMR